MIVVLNKPQLHTRSAVLRHDIEGHGPHALRMALLAPQSQEHHSLDVAGDPGLDRQPEHQALCRVDPQSQAELLGLGFLPPQRSRRRLLGEASIEADGHLVDQEDEMVAVIHDPEPRVIARRSNPLQSLLAERIRTASDRPTVIAHLVSRECDGIATGVGEQTGAKVLRRCSVSAGWNSHGRRGEGV